MALSAGTKVGPYEILAPLGAGGMGEVYRARDTRLNRDVAIKTMSAAFAGDPDRMARFQREAQVLAALNHPHIAAIYGIEESAIVMELVEGKNLTGPVPVEEAIAIARQIADALDAAHQRNIIHRDLKPANVRITAEGTVKVLDFGLAKAFDASPVRGDLANSPTLAMDSTRTGVIMGTAGYMSPEQAREEVVDRRADIWSFGVVFYELLTGRRTFEGQTLSCTLNSALTSDPDWARLPAGTPLAVRRLLERCLQPDPKKRLRDIGDAWIEMDRIEHSPYQAKVNWIPWSMAALAVIAAGAVAWEWVHVPVWEPRAVTRSANTFAKPIGTPALSRDGTRFAYAEFDGITFSIWLRMMDELGGKPIPGVEGIDPEFSPDGKWIAYVSYPPPSKIKKVPMTGGTPITLCDIDYLSQRNRLDWGLDDRIVYGSSKGLMGVASAGGTPQALTTVNTKNGESSHYSPQLLPGGQTMLFTIAAGDSADVSRIAALDLKTGAIRVLIDPGYAGRYVPSGHLAFIRGGTLFAAPFKLSRLVVTGPEAPVAEGLYRDRDFYTFSDSSTLMFETNTSIPSTLEWIDRTGVAQVLPEKPHRWGKIVVSPDGKLLAGSIHGGSEADASEDIWKYDPERQTLTRLTFEGANLNPIWTPDGRWVTFASKRDRKYGIYRVPIDNSGPEELILSADSSIYPLSWTPDGKMLLYSRYSRGASQMWISSVPANGSQGKPLLSATPFNQVGTLSPDGRWLAYESNESGKFEIYVVTFPEAGGKSQISPEGGRLPSWSRSGRELHYTKPDSMQLISVDVSAGPVFHAGRAQPLFKLTGPTVVELLYDETPDPNRFLLARFPEKAPADTLVTVTDWFDDLRRKAPIKN
jgi:eukaryotic-like serine/threonine-protein kinase